MFNSKAKRIKQLESEVFNLQRTVDYQSGVIAIQKAELSRKTIEFFKDKISTDSGCNGCQSCSCSEIEEDFKAGGSC
ncbi:hypothetical protein GZ77_26190 [Endozoicomonas montiporae]|uniref:Uncharacterized protein n=1 Tax=Endozoicomonas montiporae TaxID=1027273 RepID=A0A081MYM8_9GAMM|nr:hypothetical protein [Endozoicomonas montiporae]KEQ11247.1 hypothetical protein GZ77_26485 [Endozoicomonas montiporae]KEQ11301.1 hypothetical protein GZ77_26190 [Endozoicomonas montiporae]